MNHAPATEREQPPPQHRRADDPPPGHASWASPMLRVWGGAMVASGPEPAGASAASPPAASAVGFVCLPEREGATLVLGRDDTADITLHDAHVSRRHARLLMRRGRWFVEDLQSAWGTTLNGARVGAPAELRHGDLIIVGATALRYECFWDVLSSPRASPMRQGPEPAPSTPASPAAKPPPRAVAPPPPPPPASTPIEDNLKMVALAIIVLCCAGAIVLLILAGRAS